MRTAPGCKSAFAPFSRRQAILTGAGLLAAATAGGCKAHAARADDATGNIPTRQLGAITGNSLNDMKRFSQWLGKAQNHDLLYFNQENWQSLEQSVPYIISLGASVLAQGRNVQWSIPAGGARAYAEIANGGRDGLYQDIARRIEAIYSQSSQRVCVRLFWEFNLPEQTLAARGADGSWHPELYVAAYRRVASILRKQSNRFYFDWCPNIGAGGLPPDRCYPGDELVDVVSVDVYYRRIYDRGDRHDAGSGIFEYRRTQPFGLDWLTGFASGHGKLVGISEWGVDDNEGTVFMQRMCAWIKGLGDLLSHHNYWDRDDGGVVSRLSTGQLPAIAQIYREAFGSASAT